MQNSYDVPDNKSLVWKKNDNVPGRAVSSTIQNLHLIQNSKNLSPQKNLTKTKHRKTSSASSFQEFQDSTEDAWDVADDEICLNAHVSIHPHVAESTAMKVLSNHSKGTLFANCEVTNQASAKTDKKLSPKVPQSSYSDDVSNLNNATKNPVPPRQEAQKKTSQPERQNSSPRLASSYPHGPGIGIRQPFHKPSLFSPKNPSVSNSPESAEREAARIEAFQKLIQNANTDLKELRKLSWSGIPSKIRSVVWKLLAGHLPTSLERRETYLERKKEEYESFIGRYYERRTEDDNHETYRQIHIDVPRMSPFVPLFQQEIVQMAFERILYILAIRHPASGYVQGMNDLVTPFFVVFLQDYIPSDADVECYDVSKVSAEGLAQVESDSYWCLAKVLDGIQDNYTFAQPGIQNKVHRLEYLIQRIDEPLHNHLKRHSIEYLQFSFRWMNNLLMRELPLSCTIRLWDTYLSEINGFSNFHLYVCGAFLKYWSKDLLHEKEFQGLMVTLQNLPTLHWTDTEISLIVAEAYKLMYMFDDAPKHLQPREN